MLVRLAGNRGGLARRSGKWGMAGDWRRLDERVSSRVGFGANELNAVESGNRRGPSERKE